MNHLPHIHCIGIGGIGISALARYYHSRGYRVTGTNIGHSPLLDTLQSEGIEIVENGAMMIDRNTVKVIYTEAIIDDDTRGLDGVREAHLAEVKVAQFYTIPLLSYPEALAEVLHTFPTKIAVAGAHGKSTTSAMLGTILHDTHTKGTTITGTLVKAFNGKNICVEGDDVMVIEACEYRNAFLKYHSDVAIITNIDPDHLDFFKTEQAYFEAFETFMGSSRCVIMTAEEYEHFQDKIGRKWAKNNGTLILVHGEYFEIIGENRGDFSAGKYPYSLPELLVPGNHIRIDASLAYIASQLIGIESSAAQASLAAYPGSWRRMEIIKKTSHNNILMSDYGHHPTEILATLHALKQRYPEKKLVVFFEPHQYSRTYDLRVEFATSFYDADMTYIVDIYAARDIDERRDKIDGNQLAQMIAQKSPCEYVGPLKQAGEKLISQDSQLTNSILLLLGAGTIDELRTKL